MQNKTDKKYLYNAGKCKADAEVIHLHMCNHYRRILNAKKAVDNSPPYCYKVKRPLSWKPSVTKSKENQPFENLPLTDRSLSTNSKESCWGADSFVGSSRYHARCIPNDNTKHSSKDMDLVDRIAYDTKRGPSVYCDESWIGMKDSNNKGYGQQQNSNSSKFSVNSKRRLTAKASGESAQKRKFSAQKKLKSSRLTAKGSKSFPSLDDNIFPKTQAVSKLRSLRVYYPPRRKPLRNKTESSSNSQNLLESPHCKCTKICVCDAHETALKKISINPKEQSLTSSRDSAYNGGVSSLPESRSPTPDQRRKKECCCCCCEKKQKEGKSFEPPKVLQVESPRPQQNSPPVLKAKSQQQETFEKMQEDALYVKFIQDITTEILDKNLYTNKALKKVMKKHIKNNARKLHKDRMLKEVENLRIQLGIPEDKSLLEVDQDVESASKFYPIISDSEFVLPKNKLADDKNLGDKLSEEICNSIIMSPTRDNEETDEEVVSVVHVMKASRRDKKAETEIPQQNSSDDSDRPSDPKKRSVLKNRKQKFMRTYSSSSSDSERPGKFSRNVRKNNECPNNEYLQSNIFVKKNRSVSFWKTPDRDLGLEVEKTVTRTKDTVLRDIGRDKPKND